MSISEAAWVALVAGLLLIAVVGVFAGWVTTVVLRGDQRGFLWDAALALVGYMLVHAAGAESARQPIRTNRGAVRILAKLATGSPPPQ